jgi:hypothetical protein
MKITNLLLERADTYVNDSDPLCDPPIILAARRDNELAISLLLRRSDIEVNVQNSDGLTALSVAAGLRKWPPIPWLDNRDPERPMYKGIVNMLLGREDINVNLKDRYGMSLLARAIGWPADFVNPIPVSLSIRR